QRARIHSDGRQTFASGREGTRPDRHRTATGSDGPARSSLSARDGSPRRHAVRRQTARYQARSDRAKNPKARACREMVVRALRIVFFGTPEFALPTLDALVASPHSVVGGVRQAE